MDLGPREKLRLRALREDTPLLDLPPVAQEIERLAQFAPLKRHPRDPVIVRRLHSHACRLSRQTPFRIGSPFPPTARVPVKQVARRLARHAQPRGKRRDAEPGRVDDPRTQPHAGMNRDAVVNLDRHG